MHNIFMTFLQDLAYFLATAGAAYLVAFLRKKIGVAGMQQIAQQSALIKQIVELGVKYAEQAFQPGEKLEKATEWIVKNLADKGIIVTEEEIKALIEATVREFKDQFGEDWGKSTSKITKK